MKKERIMNVTKCDKEFFTRLNEYQTKNRKNRYTGSILMVLCLLLAMYILKKGNNTKAAIILYVIALIVLPLLFYFIPYNTRRRMYNGILKRSSLKENTIEAEFKENHILAKDYSGNSISYEYKKISMIREYKELLIIITEDRKTLYLNKNGFKKANYEDAVKLLESRTGLRIER